jgi:predicted ATPase/DNA-binding winged helix-turn-helix (wHTH) protein
VTVLYRFGRCEVDPSNRRLLVDGAPAPLGSRAFDVLLVLLERRDRLVTKAELLDLAWPGLVVEENNLQVQITALRKALGPDAIATVSGHGYRFALEVTTSAAQARDRVKHNLPAHIAPFVGREQDLADLAALLGTKRLVTIVGVGGIGKTRASQQVASGMVDHYTHGAWFVDLAPIMDARLAMGAVATALGIKEDSGKPIQESVREFARDRSLLVIVDNCEHLLPACALIAKTLVQAGPGVTVLATSREPLHVAGETILALAPLSEDASARLFLDRAAAIATDFASTPENAPAVARICRQLDGIPLAIELAAARVRVMSVDAIAGHLADRFRLLKGGDRTALPRQQTLRATMDWSYGLLSAEEQAVLRRVAVFAGGFTLDAAVAVGAVEDVPDLVLQLIDKSLVTFDARNERYSMLETVRQYALERATEANEIDDARDRHLAYFVSLADQAGKEMNGLRQAHWRMRLDAERDNILQAFARAREIPDGDIGLRLVHGLDTWINLKDAELWMSIANEALMHPRATPDGISRCRALYVTSFQAFVVGRYEEAYTLGQESLRLVRAGVDPDGLPCALYSTGIAAVSLGHNDPARALLSEMLAWARDRGDLQRIHNATSGLAELHSQLGRHDLAEPLYEEALAAVDHGVGGNIGLLNVIRNALMLGREQKALHYLRLWFDKPDVGHAAISVPAILWDISGLAVLRGNWPLALRLSGAAAEYKEANHVLAGDAVDARLHAQMIAPAREALGAADADAAFAAGRALGADAALAEGKAWLEEVEE